MLTARDRQSHQCAKGSTADLKILVYGYGNPGRQDDGLGIFLAEEVEKRNLLSVTVDTNYQLNAEDALLASEFDVVLSAAQLAGFAGQDVSMAIVGPSTAAWRVNFP